MKLLHIACGFTYSNVYKKLFLELTEHNLIQDVYVPQHYNSSSTILDQNYYPYRIYSNKIIMKWDKVLYYTKIQRMVKDIELNFKLKEINLVHAHSLFSDGAVAYEIYRKYGIPYIVAIRNTDVNKYFKYALHLRKYAFDILSNAKKIIFISPAYKDFVFYRYIPLELSKIISKKTEIISNGIEEYWLNQMSDKKNIDMNKIKLIFVGRIDKNKNLESVMEVTQTLNMQGKKCTLDIIGDGPLKEKLNNRFIGDNNFAFYGSIHDKKQLKKLYRNNDILIVPSFNETFGVVYPEAMSCGTPVIYSRYQGFDGFFNNGEIGYAVDPNDKNDIMQSILKIIDNYKNMSEKCLVEVKQFKWSLIANRYIDIYNYILSKNI